MKWIKISEQWPPADFRNFLYYDGEHMYVAYLVDENHSLQLNIVNCHECNMEIKEKCQCHNGPTFYVKPTDYWANIDYPEDNQPERSKREDLSNEDAVL